MRTAGVELARGFPLRILSPVCLPIPPRPQRRTVPEIRAGENAIHTSSRGLSGANGSGRQPGEESPDKQRECRSARQKIDKSVLTIGEPKRIRCKEHLRYVASQPCLICGRLPSHAHHVRYAQSRGISLKVSDEFTCPFARSTTTTSTPPGRNEGGSGRGISTRSKLLAASGKRAASAIALQVRPPYPRLQRVRPTKVPNLPPKATHNRSAKLLVKLTGLVMSPLPHHVTPL